MIRSMAGCKGAHPADGAMVVAAGLQLLQQQEQASLDVSRNLAPIMAVQQQQQPVPVSQEDINVDLREVYFLVMHFLANGPCTRAFGQLWNELLLHKLLPRRYHARYSREGLANEDENDDGLSFPLHYRDVANRNPDIPNNHLVDLLQQLLVNNSRSAAAVDSLSKVVTAADTPTLLGSGAFSLLDSERCKAEGVVSRWNRQMRWPHWEADQVHGLMLRELGGGFARHHRSPSVRTASYVIAKPQVFFNRIQIIRKLRGHRNAVYCAIFDRNGQHVITGSDDRLVKIWSTETGLCLRSCRGHEGDITDLAVSSSNKLVASASNDFSIRVWQLPDGFPISVLRGHGGTVTAIAFSPRQGCEHHLLSSSDDGTCRIWDARDSSVNSRVYMPDPKDSQSAARGVTVQAPPGPPPGNQILCCAFNADGSIFVTGSSDKLARVWNATKWHDELTGRPNYELDTLQGHENDVNYVQFSGCAAPTRPLPAESNKEDSQPRFKNTWSAHDSIVTCSRDGSAIIWTPRPRRHHAKAGRWVKAYHLRVPPPPLPPQPPRPGGPRQRLLPTPRGVNMIVWSLDNRFVLAAIMDCRICVWNAVDGSLVHSLTGHDKQTYVLDVHPFNPRIAMSAGYDGRVIIWDIWDGHPIRVYDTGDFNLVDGNFSPDGSSLVVSDEVGQIYLFATGEGNSQKDAKYDQFFLGDFRPLVRDTHGNVLDQETQLPPHLRNIQDLLCDPSMIPYAEPYQTIYQQRRLGALGIDWQPPTVSYQIGTLDDPPYAGPPDPPIPIQPAVVPSPDRRERRALALEGGNRWVEQPNEVDEAMDWEQEVAGLTEDSGSDYSASEECEDDGEEKADTLDEADSEEDEEEDEDDDEVRGDITIRLRRSSRNKRKAEMVTYSSSGRRLKRKRYDDGGDTHGCGRRSLRRRKGKSSRRHSPSRRASPRRTSPLRRLGASSSRHASRHRPEPSTRPKRQAARNALHLLSSINDEEEEEANPETHRKVSDPRERASGSGEPQRVLRSRNREEPEEAPNMLLTQASKVESSDRGEFSRRPRSQRKLVVKLRSSAPKAEVEDSKIEVSEEANVDARVPDKTVNFTVATLMEDHAGPSESNLVTIRPLRKLVVRHPRPLGGMKRHAGVIESSEDNHREDGNDSHNRRLGCLFDSDDQLESFELKPGKEQQSWQWKKGKAAKHARGKRPEDHSHESGSSISGSSKDVQGDWRVDIGASGSLKRSPVNGSSDLKDTVHESWENTNALGMSLDVVIHESQQASLIEDRKVATDAETSVPKSQGGEHAVLLPSLPCNGQAFENGYSSERCRVNKGSDGECMDPLQRGQQANVRGERGRSKEKNTCEGSQQYTGPDKPLLPVNGTHESAVRQNDPDTEEAVLARESTVQARVGNTDPGATSLDEETREGSGSSSGSERGESAEEDCAEGLEVSGRLTPSRYSGDEGKDTLMSVEKESSLLGGTADPVDSEHETDIEEEGDNDGDTEGGDEEGESVQQTDSDGDNSQSELFEGNEVSGRNWVESGDKDTDEESFDEGTRKTRHKRQKALGELQHYARQESTSSRREASLQLSGKTRIRHLNSVLNEGVRETRSRAGKSVAVSVVPTELPERSTRKRTKDIQTPLQNGTSVRVLRSRQGSYHDGPSRFADRDTGRRRVSQGSTSEQDGHEGSVEFETRRVVKLEKLIERQLITTERRTSGRARQNDAKKEQVVDKNRGKILEENTIVNSRGKRTRNRKRDDISWLLLTDVEAGTRYIPQYGDDVVYLRQGHQEFLDKSPSEEKGPWCTPKFSIRAVEFCRITGLEYSILQESGQTCCKLTLKFTDIASKVFGKYFKLTLPELTDDSDFIVERSRYDFAMKKGWGPRDKCQVWWRSSDVFDGGKWWDARIVKAKPKSPEFPDSPWDQFQVLYKMESNEHISHSPWELFEPGNHWHDPPHIDDESKGQILGAIHELEKSRYVGNEDDYGLRKLNRIIDDPEYLNIIPLPLDLDTVKQRLEKDYYHSIEAFRHDIELLVGNAQIYYGRDADHTEKMQKLGQVLLDAMSYYEEPPSSDGDDGDDGKDDESDDDQ